MEPTTRQAMRQLRTMQFALTGKQVNQPLIVFRHGRWHMMIVETFPDADLNEMDMIRTINFMSLYRARKRIKEWLPYSNVTPLEEVSPMLSEELEAKVLPSAEAYRTLLHNAWMTIAGGHTTDTLREVSSRSHDEEALIACIRNMMETGESGPFLHFETPCRMFEKPQGD